MDAERGNRLELLGEEVRDVLVGLDVADLDVAVRVSGPSAVPCDVPDADDSKVAIASERRVRRDTGASSGTGMLSSFMSISAHGDAPTCVDPSVLAGVNRPCQEGPAAAVAPEATAPAAATSMAAPLSEADVASSAEAGAPAMVA